jgi:hypothetical protein
VTAEGQGGGRRKDVPDAYFAGFHSKTPDRIIDGVYAGSQAKRDAPIGVWDSCMASITGR